jgi:threonine dehydrogenase-like Zn-dependent dehydrogenase
MAPGHLAGMGACTGGSRLWLPALRLAFQKGHLAAKIWWAQQGSNLWLLACKASALPLSYAPVLLRRPPEAESLPGYRFPGVWLPIQPGHETFGTIERLGPDAARRWKVRKGDRVVVHSVMRCEQCRGCMHGRPCVQTRPGSGRSYDLMHPDTRRGCGADTAPTCTWRPPLRSCRWCPVDLRAAAFHNPLANGIWWVLIAGAGTRGLARALAAKQFGAAHVPLTGLPADANRLVLAGRLGVDATVVIYSDDQAAVRERLTAVFHGSSSTRPPGRCC